jgi:ribonuclease HII
MCARAVIDRLIWERRRWKEGFRKIAGVDEAGRGPLAGPVVAAAVMLPERWFWEGVPADLSGLNDSKQLTASRRAEFFALLTRTAGEEAVCFHVAQVDAAGVDEWNILRATHRAMSEALSRLTPAPEHVLVDGHPVPTLRLPQTPLIKGDARSYSIAAASVLAKVTRDQLMTEYDRRWPAYGFAEHKGYATPQHLAALAAHGPCPIHRRSFSPVQQPELFGRS